MKMTMSTTATMSARVHRKVMRAPHKRAHPGKGGLAGKLTHPGKLAHPGKMAHAGKMAHTGKMAHAGKFAHLGKFGKLAHYTTHSHALRPPEPCENSSDSGLGPDPVNSSTRVRRSSDTSEEWEHPELKRRRAGDDSGVKVECDDAIDAYPFAPVPAAAPASAPAPVFTATTHDAATVPQPQMRASCSISSPSISETPGKRFQDPSYRSCGKLGNSGKYAGGGKLSGAGGKLTGKLGGKLGGKYGGKLAQALARRRALAAMSHSGPPGLAAPLTSKSRDGTVELQILCQPETQHRARYQTEGSRGAVKDNSGNGFPVVKLTGYDKPAVLQVFIGTDTGRVAPHMFYQACRVSGKNSTPCKERKEDGTVVIEIDLEPAKNWQVTCDCVGILKERNVDVEHRFGETLGAGAHAARGKKKSTRCRMVFRTDITDRAGNPETLQVCSTQIICTQPPGVPEVCRKSLVSCPAGGGLELYLLGKNFLKESRVVFRDSRAWEEEVVPDKEFLQQTHLVCCVPAYYRTDITEPVAAQVFVRAAGRASEPLPFYYTPPDAPPTVTRHPSHPGHPHPGHPHPGHPHPGQPAHPPHGEEERGRWAGLMPPPPPRRASLLPDAHSPLGLKTEVTDESSQHSLIEHADSSCGPDGPDPPQTLDDLKVMDLRLKSESIARDSQAQVGFVNAYESIKLSPTTPAQSEPPSPLGFTTFTQQIQAIQNQVQTDKMVESVTAAIFNSDDNAGQMYVDQPILPMTTMDPMRRLISSKTNMDSLDAEMKVLDSELMITNTQTITNMQTGVLQASNEQRMMSYNRMQPSGDEGFDPFGTMTKMEASQMERRLAQSAQMEALVEDAMKATAAMLPADAAKLDELVNSRMEEHLAGARAAAAAGGGEVLLGGVGSVGGVGAAAPPAGLLDAPVPPALLPAAAPADELMMMPDIPTSVKTPPAAVKSMILNAAAEILTSDSTMNALVTSAINTANILSTGEGAGCAQAMQAMAAEQPQAEPPPDAPLAAMSHAVSQAVTQAVSQAVSHAVSQAVSQEMTAPVQRLTDMSDQDLLSYINPSTFDQV